VFYVFNVIKVLWVTTVTTSDL